MADHQAITRRQMPRVGLGIPNFGPHASPEGIVTVAKAAERSVSTASRRSNGCFCPRPEERIHTACPTTTAGCSTHSKRSLGPAHTQGSASDRSFIDSLFQAPLVSPNGWPRSIACRAVASGPGSGRAGCRGVDAVSVPITRRGAGSRTTSRRCVPAGGQIPSSTAAVLPDPALECRFET